MDLTERQGQSENFSSAFYSYRIMEKSKGEKSL